MSEIVSIIEQMITALKADDDLRYRLLDALTTGPSAPFNSLPGRQRQVDFIDAGEK